MLSCSDSVFGAFAAPVNNRLPLFICADNCFWSSPDSTAAEHTFFAAGKKCVLILILKSANAMSVSEIADDGPGKITGLSV